MLPLEFYLSGIVVIVIIVAVFLFKVKKPTVMVRFPYHDDAEKLSKDVFAEDLVKENRRSTDKDSKNIDPKIEGAWAEHYGFDVHHEPIMKKKPTKRVAQYPAVVKKVKPIKKTATKKTPKPKKSK